MTDQHPDHDELRRRLADQGPASAPPGLADEVMRQVRAEPRRRERPAWLRPTLGLVAAVALVAAAFAGISRIGGARSSSSMGAAASAEVGPASSSGQKALTPTHSSAGSEQITRVPAPRLDQLFGPYRANGIQAQAQALACNPARVDLRVPGAVYDSVRSQLEDAAASGSAARRVTVVLHRGGSTVRTLRVTCP